MSGEPGRLRQRQASVESIRDEAMPEVVRGDVTELGLRRGRLDRPERVPLTVRLTGRHRECERVGADELNAPLRLSRTVSAEFAVVPSTAPRKNGGRCHLAAIRKCKAPAWGTEERRERDARYDGPVAGRGAAWLAR